ncbi:hypothetical protein BJ165DRAFT_1407848 [Panaeolus papilionaceus]|nr:hypothetical protein BJ165DRAFT_1407848 [Panaeolus papilionaceus]
MTLLEIFIQDNKATYATFKPHALRWKLKTEAETVGDSVEIMSGPFKERGGWVMSLNGDIATIVATQNHNVSHMEAHINWMGVMSTPFMASARHAESSKAPSAASQMPVHTPMHATSPAWDPNSSWSISLAVRPHVSGLGFGSGVLGSQSAGGM